MYRRSLRRTGIVGLAALTVSIVGRGLGLLSEFTIEQAAILTLIYCSVTLFGGLGLRTISSAFMSEKINIAEANNLNLLEDRKKSRLHFYLRNLYDSVFRFEAAVRYSDEEIRREQRQIAKNVREITQNLASSLSGENLRFLGVESIPELVDHMSACHPLKPRQLEASWEGFRITATYALTHPLPATLEAEIIGFDLTMVEDWLDGACFDANDVKLLEQYKANSTVFLIKRQLRLGVLDRAWQRWKAFSHSFWFHNTFRTIAISVGTQIKKLNRAVGTGYFKAEHFLWMEPALDRSVEQKFGSDVLQTLIRRRHRLIWKIFSRQYEGAVELLRRIYRPKIQLAVDLRKRFDVEYFLGELDGESYLHDLERLSLSSMRINRQRPRLHDARKSQTLLARYLRENPQPFADITSLQRRALRIAVHLNLSHLRDLLARYYAPQPAPHAAAKRPRWQNAIHRILLRTAATESLFSDRLVTVRTFSTLNWLEFHEYCHHLREIAYAEGNARSASLEAATGLGKNSSFPS
jgi:hypothetical protein